ncbi:hypothetical protein V6Z11_D07G014300 [Gossypium hirsutum]
MPFSKVEAAIEETKQRKKQRAKRAEKEGKKERKKEKEKGRFKVLRFQAQLLMSCTSHCPRKERGKWTRSDLREIPDCRKPVFDPASEVIPTSETF